MTDEELRARILETFEISQDEAAEFEAHLEAIGYTADEAEWDAQKNHAKDTIMRTLSEIAEAATTQLRRDHPDLPADVKLAFLPYFEER